jgi:hypothetical protein
MGVDLTFAGAKVRRAVPFEEFAECPASIRRGTLKNMCRFSAWHYDVPMSPEEPAEFAEGSIASMRTPDGSGHRPHAET